MKAPAAATTVAQKVNPWALRVSHRVPPWATLHHVGRRSGRAYDTPVVAFAAREPRVIGEPVTVADARDIIVLHPLPWGPCTDWCRNVLAAGRYTLTRRGQDFAVVDPWVLDGETARGALGDGPRVASRLLGIDEFLAGRLRPARSAPA